MDRAEILQLLATHDTFGAAPEDKLDDFIAAGEVRELVAGTELLSQGKPGEAIWILIEGQLGVFVEDAKVNEITENGAVFGEISAISLTPATATVSTLGVAKVLRVPHPALHRLMEKSPTFAETILRSMAKYLGKA